MDDALAPVPEHGVSIPDKPTSGQRPNIVFILADDMGYGDLSTINFGVSDTPNLDALMREGTFLSQQYAGSAVCTPSRACLLTGRYPHRTGAPCLNHAGSNVHDRLGLGERTVGDMLSNAGYVTGLVGKWHLGSDDKRYMPAARGFDEAITMTSGRTYWNWKLDLNGTPQAADGRYFTDVLTTEATSFIQRHRDESFFLYLAYNAPHNPLEAPEEEIQYFRDAGLTENVARLYAMVRRLDRGVGQVLDELKRQGLEENTLVVFASDNGPMFGTSWTDRTSTTRYNAGFSGHKDLVYEGGIRVPGIVRWPAGLPGRQVLHDMVHFNDWLPTLLAAAGVAPSEDIELDGRSILPILRGEKGIVAPRMYWQFSRFLPWAEHNTAMRDGLWKLVRPTPDDVTSPILGVPQPRGLIDTSGWDPATPYVPRPPEPLPPQLFNLAEDPQEQRDLSAEHPEKVTKMTDQLDQWFESVMVDMHRHS